MARAYCPNLQDYAKFHSEAVGLLKKLPEESSKFREFCILQHHDPKSNGLSLISLLITPIQRVPRYLLLLRELQQYTLEDHPDQAGITKVPTLPFNPFTLLTILSLIIVINLILHKDLPILYRPHNLQSPKALEMVGHAAKEVQPSQSITP